MTLQEHMEKMRAASNLLEPTAAFVIGQLIDAVELTLKQRDKYAAALHDSSEAFDWHIAEPWCNQDIYTILKTTPPSAGA